MNLKEKKKSIEELYKALFSIRESLQESVSMAQEAVNISQQFGGEIPRVVTDQLNSYFIPIISKFIDDEDTPGAMTPLVVFLDSVPLAMTREEPTPEEITPSPITTTDNLTQPPVEGEDVVVDNPAEGSYASLVQEKEEKKSDKEVTSTEGKFFVKRKSNGASTLGEEGRIKDNIVGTFDTEEEAGDIATYLNSTVFPEEKEMFGVEYYAEPAKKFKQDVPEGDVDKKPKVNEALIGKEPDWRDVEALIEILGDTEQGWGDIEEALGDTLDELNYHGSMDSAMNTLTGRYSMTDEEAARVATTVQLYLQDEDEGQPLL